MGLGTIPGPTPVQAETGKLLVVEYREHVQPDSGKRNHSFVQPPVAVSVGRREQPAGSRYAGRQLDSVVCLGEPHELFAQDSWKVARRLTFEYGIRFQHTTPTYTYTRDGSPPLEGTWLLYSVDLTKYNPSAMPVLDLSKNGLVVGNALEQLQANGLVCDPCNGTPPGFSPTKNFVAPRLGFAYDIFGDGKMTLRGGFGTYYERLRQNNFHYGVCNF